MKVKNQTDMSFPINININNNTIINENKYHTTNYFGTGIQKYRSDKIDYGNEDKIIIADDHETILNSLTKIFNNILEEKKKNIKILKAKDGIDILKHVYEHHSNIKLIISDENMEFLNGSETMKILKYFERSNKIKPIKLAILSSDNKSEYYKEIGIDKVLDKNFNKQSFYQLLGELGII